MKREYLMSLDLASPLLRYLLEGPVNRYGRARSDGTGAMRREEYFNMQCILWEQRNESMRRM